jgi:hypothetical protein
MQQAQAAGATDLVTHADGLRREAIGLLASARAALDAAGNVAAKALMRAAERAPEARRFWESTIRPAEAIGVGHTALDWAGMVPGVGAAPDGVNAVWYLASGDVPNAAISAMGMLPIFGDAIIGGRLVRNVDRRITKLTDGVANPMPERLYIAGSRSNGNLTPRPQDTSGLSSFDNLDAPIFTPGSKVQPVATAKLKDLMVYGPDGPNGHYSIRPRSQPDLDEWIASRGGGDIHPYTQELRDSLLDDFRLPRKQR